MQHNTLVVNNYVRTYFHTCCISAYALGNLVTNGAYHDPPEYKCVPPSHPRGSPNSYRNMPLGNSHEPQAAQGPPDARSTEHASTQTYYPNIRTNHAHVSDQNTQQTWCAVNFFRLEVNNSTVICSRDRELHRRIRFLRVPGIVQRTRGIDRQTGRLVCVAGCWRHYISWVATAVTHVPQSQSLYSPCIRSRLDYCTVNTAGIQPGRVLILHPLCSINRRDTSSVVTNYYFSSYL